MNRPRVLVIGLDGADWRIVDPLIAEGKLPVLSKLIESGARSTLHSSIPPVSAAAWVSFMLGSNPGRHGILDFREVDARRYEGTTGHIVNSNDYPKATLFDEAGHAGRRVAAIRIPMTYPAWPLNGVLISGPPTPDERRLFSYPEHLAGSLYPGNLDIGNKLLEYPEARQADILRAQLRRTRELGARLFHTAGDHDLTMVVVNTPDNAHHCFWPVTGAAQDNRMIREMYMETDAFVGAMLEARPWDLTVVMSDHGGGPRASWQLSINAWLEQLGYLRLGSAYRSRLSDGASLLKRRFRRTVRLIRRWAPEPVQRRVSSITQLSTAIDWSKTRAYGVHLFPPYFGIEINLQGRQTHGVVPANEFKQARHALVDRLRGAAGPLLVEHVMTREDAYGGQAVESVPDIIVKLRKDAEGVNVLGAGVLSPVSPPGANETQSYHAPDGILILAGRGVISGSHAGASIEDMAPTLLSYMGIPAPGHMTGRVLEDIFEPTILNRDRGRQMPTPAAADHMTPVTPEEEEQMSESLRGLGYIE